MTGDCAEQIDASYKLHGRANIDGIEFYTSQSPNYKEINWFLIVLHFWGFTVHTAEVENALLSLPYVEQAVVFPLEDEYQQERVAAVLTVKGQQNSVQFPDLIHLRYELTERTGLMEFKQPTIIRWLRDNEEITLTANGKISKVDIRRTYFGESWRTNDRVDSLDMTTMEYWRMGGQCWFLLQRSSEV